MTSEPRCADLIERYLCTRGSRYFRGAHDGEYFYVANARPRRLYVHLAVCPARDDVLMIRVAPTCFFPATESPWLMLVADAWNREDREVTAIVHASSDPQRIGVVARTSQWIGARASFEDFAFVVDGAIADAIDLFSRLTPATELPPTATPLVRDAG